MFYCYIWKRPNGEPFYVGIGDKNRLRVPQRNAFADAIKTKIEAAGQTVIIDLYEHSTRAEAASQEIMLIKLYGRRDLGTGTLANLTDGGEYGAPGSTFNRGRKHTEEAKRKISTAHKGNAYRKGKKSSEETKAKLSLALKGNQNLLGHKHTEETKARIRAYRFTDEQLTKVIKCNARRERDEKGKFK